jgi:hypothetical protein
MSRGRIFERGEISLWPSFHPATLPPSQHLLICSRAQSTGRELQQLQEEQQKGELLFVEEGQKKRKKCEWFYLQIFGGIFWGSHRMQFPPIPNRIYTFLFIILFNFRHLFPSVADHFL